MPKLKYKVEVEAAKVREELAASNPPLTVETALLRAKEILGQNSEYTGNDLIKVAQMLLDEQKNQAWKKE